MRHLTDQVLVFLLDKYVQFNSLIPLAFNDGHGHPFWMHLIR